MEIPFSYLLLCFIFFFFSVHVHSQQPYSPPDKYFLNCGSQTTVVDDAGRNFTGDANFRFSPKTSREEVNHVMNSPSLNDSVRIFNQPTVYEFEINRDAFHIVRLHFYPFNFLADLSTSHFDVSTAEFFLLKDVNATNVIRDDSASIKEFFLRLKPGNFRVYFLPNPSSVAYVNAIEVFPAPPNFIPSDAMEIISDGRNTGTPNVLTSFVLHTIYRINVGASESPTNRDKLWRKWEPDDTFILKPNSANNTHTLQSPKYLNQSDDYFAPDFVYQTAKSITGISIMINSSNPPINITWSFPLRKHTLHLLRVHFYDFISITSGGFLFFNLSIGNSFRQKIPPPEYDLPQNYPFHLDFLVDSGEGGWVNVSVSPLGRNDSAVPNAFLNGVEIMEAVDEHSKVPIIGEFEERKQKRVSLFVGLAVGLFGLLCILGCVIFFGLRRRKSKIDEGASHWTPLHVFGGGSTHGTSSSFPIPNLNLGLRFSLGEIKTATNNFNNKFLIGEGGFGKVYKGVVRNGMKVAVKRSQPGAGHEPRSRHSLGCQ